MIPTPPRPRLRVSGVTQTAAGAGLDRDQSVGQVEGAVYWADNQDVYNHRAATTAMRNNLHKSHVGCCYVAAKVRFRQLAYYHYLNTFRLFT